MSCCYVINMMLSFGSPELVARMKTVASQCMPWGHFVEGGEKIAQCSLGAFKE
jgi:hypothetical protein